MPIVVPGQRNLSQETFTSYLVALRDEAKRKEAEEQREAAADAAGNTALAGTAGLIIGGLLAIPTGGASLALAAAGTSSLPIIAAGAAIGSGVGTAIGGLAFGDDLPPGQQQQVIAGGLTQAAEGIIRQFQIQGDAQVADETKELKFKEFLIDIGGTAAIGEFGEFKKGMIQASVDNGKPKPTSTQVANAFLEQRSATLQKTMQDNDAGVFAAKRKALSDSNAVTAYNNSPIRQPVPGVSDPRDGLPIPYEYTPQQIEELQKLNASPAAIKNSDLPAGSKIEANLQITSQRNALIPKLRRTPNQPTTVGGYRKQNKPIPPGIFVPFEEGGKTGLTMSTGNASSFVSNNGEVTDPGSPITYGIETKTGKRFFKSMKLSDGRVIFANQPFINPDFPEAGAKYFDNDGELKDYDTRKAGDDPRAEFVELGIDSFIKAALKQEDATIDVAQVLAVGKKFGEAFDEQAAAKTAAEEESAFQEAFEGVISGGQAINAMSALDPKFKKALGVFMDVKNNPSNQFGRKRAAATVFRTIESAAVKGVLSDDVLEDLSLIMDMISRRIDADKRQ